VRQDSSLADAREARAHAVALEAGRRVQVRAPCGRGLYSTPTSITTHFAPCFVAISGCLQRDCSPQSGQQHAMRTAKQLPLGTKRMVH
jgi:hypothetical protein